MDRIWQIIMLLILLEFVKIIKKCLHKELYITSTNFYHLINKGFFTSTATFTNFYLSSTFTYICKFLPLIFFCFVVVPNA